MAQPQRATTRHRCSNIRARGPATCIQAIRLVGWACPQTPAQAARGGHPSFPPTKSPFLPPASWHPSSIGWHGARQSPHRSNPASEAARAASNPSTPSRSQDRTSPHSASRKGGGSPLRPSACLASPVGSGQPSMPLGCEGAKWPQDPGERRHLQRPSAPTSPDPRFHQGAGFPAQTAPRWPPRLLGQAPPVAGQDRQCRSPGFPGRPAIEPPCSSRSRCRPSVQCASSPDSKRPPVGGRRCLIGRASRGRPA